jgi:hypothetical protein
MDYAYDFETDFLNCFEEAAKKDIAKYLEENKLEGQDEDEFYDEMELLLFNSNDPEIYKNGKSKYGDKYKLCSEKECYRFIDYYAEMLNDAIEWVKERYEDEIGDEYKYDGIVKLFGMVWYLVGRNRIRFERERINPAEN